MEKSINHWKGYQWVVLYTNPRAEKQVALNLTDANIENYLPLVRQRRKWSDRMKWVELPLLSSYVFARIKATELGLMRQVDGVVCPITFGQNARKVALISDETMETFKKIVEIEQENCLLKAGEFVEGAKVRVLSGVYQGQEGLLLQKEGETLFGVKIEGIIFAIAAKIDEKFLQIIDEEEEAAAKAKADEEAKAAAAVAARNAKILKGYEDKRNGRVRLTRKPNNSNSQPPEEK